MLFGKHEGGNFGGKVARIIFEEAPILSNAIFSRVVSQGCLDSPARLFSKILILHLKSIVLFQDYEIPPIVEGLFRPTFAVFYALS